jgi:hypothetical protein
MLHCSYGVDATTLVSLLLELNIINAQDVDRELKRLAADINSPQAARWFMRVVRYFIINVDQLIAAPYRAKAKERSHWSSKYYYAPTGGWRGPKIPESKEEEPEEVIEPDPEGIYTSMLHAPVAARDLEQSFSKFKPAKAKAKRLPGEPPTKKELQPWMTPEKELWHFDPVQVRRRELWTKLENLVDFLNYESHLLSKKDSEDPNDRIRSEEATKFFRYLETMPTADVDGFRDVMREAQEFASDVVERPWLYTKDGKTIAEHGSLSLKKAILIPTGLALSKRTTADGSLPTWCTKTEGQCAHYLGNGPLYFVDKNDKPYVLIHFESNQARAIDNMEIEPRVAAEIAPLFIDPNRFPMATLSAYSGRGITNLADAVQKLRRKEGIRG